MNKDNYNGEKEIWMKLQESADKFRAETVEKRLYLSGGVGESFIFPRNFDSLYLSIYADDFLSVFTNKMEEAKNRGYTGVQITYHGSLKLMTIEEAIAHANWIEDQLTE